MRHLLLIATILLPLTSYSQSWLDFSEARPYNFDKLLMGEHKMIYIAPPEGKYWVLATGSFASERSLPGGAILVWLDHAPYAPYRDPVTREMKGCVRCVNLIRVDSIHTFVPIIGGTAADAERSVLVGQTMPIVIRYPNRMMIAVNGLRPSETLQTRVRFMIVERDLSH